ncbi:hypothetical protein MRX96_022836 [Rhipicephalus microplus]
MVVTARRLRCGALLSCCLLVVRTLASEQPASYYDIRPSDGLNETGPWDVFFNDTTLVFSYDPVATNVTDSGQDEPLSSPSWEERYDLLPLQNDSSRLLEYREPFQPLPSLTDEERKTVYLLGLFELTGSCDAAKGGRAERAAARLAIRHVNERNVVPGHRLEMYDNDTRWPVQLTCDAGAAINAFFHAIYRKQQMTMLLGTSSSEVTERLAKVVSYWGVLQISFGSLSSVLSDRAGFPLFFRTVAPDSSHNAARVAFLRRYRWDTVATLHEDDELYALAINELLTQLEGAHIAVSSSESVTRNDFLEQIQELKNTDSRIIIGSFSRQMARKIFCEVYKQGMYGADFQWIVQGGLGEWWLDPSGTDCLAGQLRAAAENIITVAAYTGSLPNRASVSGLQMDAFRRELDAELESELRSGLEPLPAGASGYRGHVTQVYDAVWTTALALRSAELLWRKAKVNLTLSDFRYEKLLPETGGGGSYHWNETVEPPPPPQERRMANYFDRIISRLSFNGLSGPISFSGSDRVGITEFQQNQGGLLRKVALYIPDSKMLDFSCIRCRPIIWQDGEPPVARRIVKLSVATIQRSVFISVSVLATVGMLLAIAFLAFNLYYRKSKYIKLSSPKLNNMTVVGCLLVYVAIVVLGLDYDTLGSDTRFTVFCTVRAFLLSGGFSLAFGAIFIKTYRVHHLFVRASSGVIKNKLLQDQQLIALVCVLVLIDCAIVTLWVTFDPMERIMRNLTMQISRLERDVVYLPQREQCHSEHMAKWLGALYIYKGLLLVVGCYMAWETRNVQIPALNDSQYIGMSVYNAVITSALVVALANVISTERYTLTYALVGTVIFVSTTTTLCLLFLPKASPFTSPVLIIHAIINKTDADAVVASSGVRVEFNTRRFAIDERRELYYRTEVQSRAYAREIAELDAEIARLKRLLGEPLCAETSSENNSVKSESPLSSLLERFKRKRASLENSEAAGIAVISRLNAPMRSPARVHDLRWRVEDGTRMLQLRAEDLLLPPRHSFHERSNECFQQSRGSLPIIAATQGERESSREEVYQSAELVPTSDSVTTANTTEEYRTLSSDEYRTLSSDDDTTYVSCRSPAFTTALNHCPSSSSCPYTHEPLELAVLEEASNDEGIAESSASTTPVAREATPLAGRLQTERELFLKRLEEAESVDV